MNFDEIFKLFNVPQPIEDNDDNLLIDFSNHPLYWISGFNKMINNYNFTIKYLKKSIPEVSSNNLEIIGKSIMYYRAWDFIKKLKIDNQFHIDCIKETSSHEFFRNLESSIIFFEKLEEYEKCALLKNISEKVKENLI